MIKINFINEKKLKKGAFVLCIGGILGISSMGFKTGDIHNVFKETPVSEMTLDEKLDTRGGVHVYFANKEYLTEKDDFVSFSKDNKQAQGIVYSSHDDYVITFAPGNYTFYIQSFDKQGSFEVTEEGEIEGEMLNLVVDYKKEDYSIEKASNYSMEGRKGRR